MTSSFVRALVAGLRTVGRICLVTILLCTVSGSLTPALQSVAWIEMARDAGGVHRLAEAMFEFEPCEHCHAIKAMSRESSGSPEKRLPQERHESLRLFATLEKDVEMPDARTCRISSKYPNALSDSAPRSRVDRPMVPPPRAGFLLV